MVKIIFVDDQALLDIMKEFVRIEESQRSDSERTWKSIHSVTSIDLWKDGTISYCPDEQWHSRSNGHAYFLEQNPDIEISLVSESEGPWMKVSGHVYQQADH